MSTETATRKPTAVFAADRSFSASFKGHPIEMQDDGTAIIRGIEVFRAGTFRDMWGEQRTWTDEHLAQMVGHFELLRSTGNLPDVPVRRDHSRSVDQVMAYVESVYVNDAGRLATDIHVTEPDQIEKIGRGTYRSVSAEIGMYETNDGAMYYPVLTGFAYVDLPAVEGLHSKSTPEVTYFSRVPASPTQESPVTKPNDASTDTKPDDVAPPAPASHAAPAPEITCFGRKTSDFAVVQKHIDDLEATVKAAADQSRKDFVAGLAKENKITAAQVEGLEAFALSLPAEAYTAWTATYESAAPVTLLAEHGAAGGGGEAEGGYTAAERLQDEESLQFARKTGLTEEAIAKLPAAQRLAAHTSK